MFRNEPGGKLEDLNDRRPRASATPAREHPGRRTIVIRHGSVWLPLAFLCLCALLVAVVLLGHRALRELDSRDHRAASAMTAVERRIQQLEAGSTFDSRRRYLLLGMRDHILRTNPRVSLGDAYRYAELALQASEKYPAVDPLLLVAIGTVESGYDPMATSHADARGLYQIWPSTGRLLVRSLGWEYDESTLYDPEKNTQAAALYLDILFSAYGDPSLVLAEYNGGPLNAGYYRARVGALAAETKNYVPRVLELHRVLREKFAQGMELQGELMHRDAAREGKTLTGGSAAPAPAPKASGKGQPPEAATPRP